MERRWVSTKVQLVCLLASSLTIGLATASSAANLLLDQAEFLAAAGTVTVETFESVPLSGTADSGALPSIPFPDFSVASVPNAVKVLGAPYYGHHNTTPGGSRYLSIDTDLAGVSGYVTLTFDGPIYSIGFFLIGIEHTSMVENRPVEILLDGVEYPIPTTPYDGNRYMGLLSSTPFTTLEIHADPVDSFWSIDDVAFSTQASAAGDTDVFYDEVPFLAATVWLGTEDFEAAPPSGTLDGGALAQIAFDDFTASSVPDAVKVFDAPYAGNHNTTPGGSHYLAFDTDVGSLGASASLVFDEPVNDVGFFLVNAEDFTPNDSTPVAVAVAGTEYPIPPPGASGEVFFGVVRESGFTQIEVYPDAFDSFWSIDDVSYVPEASARAMAWLGASALLVLARIRGRSAAFRGAACAPASATGFKSIAIPLAACLLLLTLAGPGFASDGVLEINQTCALQTGCFSGDTAGFPVTIDGTAGRGYRLTSDLTVSDENTDGIVVSTDDIGIDLNSFSIRGPVTCSGSPLTCTPASGSGSGVKRVSVTNRGISVRNGSITGMGQYGVLLGDQAELMNLRARWNRAIGIFATTGSIISGNTAYQNGQGITGGSGSTVSGNTAYQNGTFGITGGDGATVSGNTGYQNGGIGISAAAGSTVSGNTAYQNGGDGISAGFGATVSGNTAYDNGDATNPTADDGIQCTQGCIVHGNTVRENSGQGLALGTDSAYSDNVVTSNATGTVAGLGSANNRGGNYCAGPGTVSASCP